MYLFHDVCVDDSQLSILDTDRPILLSRSLGHHVRTLAFGLAAEQGNLEQARQEAVANCVAQVLPNIPNLRYLIIRCHPWKTLTYSVLSNVIAKLQHLEWVAFEGLGYRQLDQIYYPQSPTFFETIFIEILSSHMKQITSLSLDQCPLQLAPGAFQLLRGTMSNLQHLILNSSLPMSLWQAFAQPVVWACADQLITLDVTEIHGAYVPTLVEHIASGRFGNLKRLLVDMFWSSRDRNIVAPALEWSISPLDALVMIGVPKLELEIFGCLHAKEVSAERMSEQAIIELVQGGGFRGMKLLKVRLKEWKIIRLEVLMGACATRGAKVLAI